MSFILKFLSISILVLAIAGCNTTTSDNNTTTSTSTTATSSSTSTTLGTPRIVAVGDTGTTSSTIIYSDDYGATWTSVSETTYREDLNCLVYDTVSGRYYAGGDDGKILHSSTGTSWSVVTGTSDSDDEFYGIASDNAGKLVAVGDSYYVWGPYYYGPVRYRNLSGSTYYNYLVHSSDELAGGVQNSGYLYGVAADSNSKFVAVGKRVLSNPTETISISRYSTDGGANWTEYNSNATIGIGTGVQLRDVAATAADTFYAVGNSGTFIMSSNGSTSWSTVGTSISSSLTLYAIAADSNSAATTMVIVGSSGTIIKGTKSGSTWTWDDSKSGVVTSNTLIDVATDGNGNWVAVGTLGKVIYSTDNAVTWSTGSSGISKELWGVAFGD